MKDQNWLAFYFQSVISAYVFGDNLVEYHFAEYETIQTDEEETKVEFPMSRGNIAFSVVTTTTNTFMMKPWMTLAKEE